MLIARRRALSSCYAEVSLDVTRNRIDKPLDRLIDRRIWLFGS